MKKYDYDVSKKIGSAPESASTQMFYIFNLFKKVNPIVFKVLLLKKYDLKKKIGSAPAGFYSNVLHFLL